MALQDGLDEADGIEFDIRHTADGTPILMHDQKLKRTAEDRNGWNCPRRKKINSLMLEDIQNKCILKNGQSIPTLKEALDQLQIAQQFIFIELKDRPNQYTKEIILEKFQNRLDQVRIISFSKKVLDHFQNLKTEIFQNISFRTMHLSFFQKKRQKNSQNVYYKFLNKKKTDGELGAWTVNKKQKMKKLIKNDVDYITTDRADLCMRIKSRSFLPEK
jgi:glycerophosphoryl diester phosphodiesterase